MQAVFHRQDAQGNAAAGAILIVIGRAGEEVGDGYNEIVEYLQKKFPVSID